MRLLMSRWWRTCRCDLSSTTVAQGWWRAAAPDVRREYESRLVTHRNSDPLAMLLSLLVIEQVKALYVASWRLECLPLFSPTAKSQ
eukprot:1177903-Pyramimonas_sp.AAC.1